MSIGFFLERNAAVVWRGPMLHKAIQQFLEDVAWDELDYLLLDLPPGTGDVSMTLAQLLPAGAGRGRDHARSRPRRASPAAPPRWRQGRPRGARRDREHVRLHDPRRPALHDLRRGRRPSCSPTSSTCPCSGKVPLSEELREHADTRHAAGRSPIPHAPAVDRDPRRGARDHRRHAAGAAGDAGRVARGAGPGADRRHRAARGPGLGLSDAGPALRDQSLVVGRARRRPRGERVLRRRGLPRGQARPCGRSSSRRSATSPGKRLAHLQCHFGLDTLSWARAGASVVGLDFSEPAVRGGDASSPRRPGSTRRFVQADVYDAVAALDGERFDIVYTGLGALNWLPDLPRWAGVVADLLEAGRIPLPRRVPPVHLGVRRGRPRDRARLLPPAGGRELRRRHAGQLRGPGRPDPQQRHDRVGAHARGRGHRGARRRACGSSCSPSTTTPSSPASRTWSRTATCSAPAWSTASPRARRGCR